MRSSRAPVLALVVLLGSGLAPGCQVYLSGGPAEPWDAAPAAHDDAPRPAPAEWAIDPERGAPAATPEHVPTSEAAPAIATGDEPSPPPRTAAARATFPGERYYRAGRARDVLTAVEDALVARDFRILRSGADLPGGEVHAERRTRLDRPPRTTTSPAWTVHAAVVRITGTTWEDCCYVKAAFTTTRLNARGDVLGTAGADDPENETLRAWFLDEVGLRLQPPPAY